LVSLFWVLFNIKLLSLVLSILASVCVTLLSCCLRTVVLDFAKRNGKRSCF